MAGKKPGKKPGSPKTGGRKKGTPNKMTKDLKEMILAALDGAGGKEYLQKQADENPKAFLTLLGRVLPMQVKGDSENPITIVVRRYGSSDPE